MRVRIPALGMTVTFDAGEELRTEISAKFRPSGLSRELAAAGFTVRRWFLDPGGDFSVVLAAA